MVGISRGEGWFLHLAQLLMEEKACGLRFERHSATSSSKETEPIQGTSRNEFSSTNSDKGSVKQGIQKPHLPPASLTGLLSYSKTPLPARGCWTTCRGENWAAAEALCSDYEKKKDPRVNSPHLTPTPSSHRREVGSLVGFPSLWSARAWHRPLSRSPPGVGPRAQTALQAKLWLDGGQEACRSLRLWEENNREGPFQKTQGKASSGDRGRPCGQVSPSVPCFS